MTDIDDAAAFEHYNDPANRDPGPGPPVRRRDSLQIREVKVTLPAVHGTAELTRGLDIAPALVVFNLRALDARSPNSEMPTRPASPSIPNRSPRAVRMAKRRARRRIAKTPPRAAAPRAEPGWPAKRAVTRQTPFVERLAYTRSQAAEALGLSRSTFTRRVLPHVATVEMPWGAKLIPVDELERLLAERGEVFTSTG